MSCRIVTLDEASRLSQARWPELNMAPPPPEAPPPELDLAREALTESVGQIAEMHQQIAELEQELVRREQLGYERGLAEGIAQGRTEATEQQKPVLERMSHAIAEVAMLRPKLRMQTESDLINLSMTIARRVLNQELRSDEMALEGIVRAALQRCGTAEIVKVRAHPAQAQAIRGHLNRLGVPESVVVEANAQMQEGDVLLETTAGALDASVNTQMEEIERGLTTRLGTA